LRLIRAAAADVNDDQLPFVPPARITPHRKIRKTGFFFAGNHFDFDLARRFDTLHKLRAVVGIA